jgi:hypothetical protein
MLDAPKSYLELNGNKYPANSGYIAKHTVLDWYEKLQDEKVSQNAFLYKVVLVMFGEEHVALRKKQETITFIFEYLTRWNVKYGKLGSMPQPNIAQDYPIIHKDLIAAGHYFNETTERFERFDEKLQDYVEYTAVEFEAAVRGLGENAEYSVLMYWRHRYYNGECKTDSEKEQLSKYRAKVGNEVFKIKDAKAENEKKERKRRKLENGIAKENRIAECRGCAVGVCANDFCVPRNKATKSENGKPRKWICGYVG